jgi:hypothetical protein
VRLFERWNRRLPSAGHLALAALAVGVVTGIVLAAGYDVGAARRSLALLELTSRSGRVVRAVHAWSGHLLLLLALAHAVEHLALRSEAGVPTGRWIRIVAAAPLLIGLLLSGFVLKGDAEGELARSVVRGLLQRLPAGSSVATALTGVGTDLQVAYVHHVATLTIAVAAIAIEHGRRLWPSVGAVAGALLACLAGSALLSPGLHDGVEPIVKGPWYVVAIQEALHWLSRPEWLWVAAAAPLAALAILPRLSGRWRAFTLRLLVAGLVAYAALGVFGQLFRGEGWAFRVPWARLPASRADVPILRPLAWGSIDETRTPVVRGTVEGCLGCHDEVTGIEPAHASQAVGCSGCHLGDPQTPDAAAAHAGMVRVPGNLDTATLTCGQSGCHGSAVDRVRGSLMATVRGMIAVDRWAFGEQDHPDGTDGVAQLTTSPADTHLRQMCVGCHLGRLKEKPGPATELSRGGGCVACHLREPERRDYAPANPRRFAHPQLTVRVEDRSCFGCHSRSARIALTYAGWWESGVGEDEVRSLPAGSWRRLQDGRLVSRAPADVHHDKGMACVDCHTAGETMGDGKAHAHEEQATRVRCETCHRTAPGRGVAVSALEPSVQATIRARLGDAAPQRLLLEDRTGEVLTNAWELPDGAVELRGKIGARRHVGTPPAPACSAIRGHERLSCQSCHTPWVTTCVSCHTQWDRAADRLDVLGTGRRERGAWVEYDGRPRRDAPALGVHTRDGVTRIEPVVPGMILTLNGPDVPAPDALPETAEPLVGERTRFLRAYALAVPHTTTTVGRSCASCHRDPFALGYGRGELSLEQVKSAWEWRFEPEHEVLPQDGLPADAWIAFLGGPGAVATRRALAPLERDAQLRTLAVGACLECHDPATHRGRAIYSDFRASLGRATASCRVPPSPAPARASAPSRP